jgi:hypothetical protein
MFEFINDLESFGMFLCFVEFGAVLESFEVGPEDADSIEKVGSKIKVIFFAQS